MYEWTGQVYEFSKSIRTAIIPDGIDSKSLGGNLQTEGTEKIIWLL